jgi:hypothetical protein
MSEKKINFEDFFKSASKILKDKGYEIVLRKKLIDYYLHKYNSYEEYKEAQIKLNKRKIELTFADEKTLKKVSNIVTESIDIQKTKPNKVFGICHGSRNGFEQNLLNKIIPNSDIIGTDISDTALKFENTVHWDFHDKKDEWIGKFDFVYSNSLDQSWKPKHALSTWLDQIKDDGVVIIEHTIYHSPEHAGEGDPFGVRPLVMPYLLTEWFGHKISISHYHQEKSNVFSSNIKVWLFVLKKN